MKIEISNVIDYKDILHKKLDAQIELLDKGYKVPDRLKRQIDKLIDWDYKY